MEKSFAERGPDKERGPGVTALDLARARIAQLEREQAQQIETTTTMRQTVQKELD
jgi:hypothetical protein